MIVHHDFAQHEWDAETGHWFPTQEWYNARHGKITGTAFKELMGTPAARRKLIQRITIDRLKKPKDAWEHRYSGKSAQRGIDLEPMAAEAIERKHGVELIEPGFITLSDYHGISPDPMSKDMKRVWEFKSLESQAMGEIIFKEDIPKDHFWQIVGYFLIPTVDEVNLTLFVPGIEMLDERDWIHEITVERLDVWDEIEQLEDSLQEAEEDIKVLTRKIKY